MAAGNFTVLHYSGHTADRGGVHAVIRGLAAGGAGAALLGVSPGFRLQGEALPLWEGPPVAGETIGLANAWRARAVARAVQAWLAAGPDRIFHGHSRAGLLVALWLHRLGERRFVVSVHCYGRQRWFYRWAKKVLGPRLRWLTPAMKRYYRSGEDNWDDCVPNGLPGVPAAEMRRWPGGRPLRVGGGGALSPYKRWDLVLDALALLPADAPVEYLHLGGVPDDPATQEFARALEARAAAQLAGRVRWLGWQPDSREWLQTVDVVVVPNGHEAFSLVAMEALFAGVPVIAARGGGPDDFIADGRNGWLVAANDAAALAKKFEQLLAVAAWPDLPADGAALRRFTREAVAWQWREIYAAL